MSRVAKKPIIIPKGVQIEIQGQTLIAKGTKGQMTYHVHEALEVVLESDILKASLRESAKSVPAGTSEAKHRIFLNAMLGTTCAQLRNVVTGVSQGYERKLELKGVGYRAQVKGKFLDLSLGFSHPTNYPIPEGITIEMPSQTEIIIKGMDKQRVGQVAAEIRSIRPVEPYKGKGVRYFDEVVILKETKK